MSSSKIIKVQSYSMFATWKNNNFSLDIFVNDKLQVWSVSPPLQNKLVYFMKSYHNQSFLHRNSVIISGQARVCLKTVQYTARVYVVCILYMDMYMYIWILMLVTIIGLSQMILLMISLHSNISSVLSQKNNKCREIY
jgi:hypothetical protein